MLIYAFGFCNVMSNKAPFIEGVNKGSELLGYGFGICAYHDHVIKIQAVTTYMFMV